MFIKCVLFAKDQEENQNYHGFGTKRTKATKYQRFQLSNRESLGSRYLAKPCQMLNETNKES